MPYIDTEPVVSYRFVATTTTPTQWVRYVVTYTIDPTASHVLTLISATEIERHDKPKWKPPPSPRNN